MSLPLLALIMIFQGCDFSINRREAKELCILGFLMSASSIFLYLAYNHMDAGIASTVLFVYPILTAILMTVVFKEKNNMLVWLCLLAATIGIGILSKSDGVVYVTMLGVLLSILSAVVYAFYLTFINKGSLGGMPSVKITFYVMTFGTLLIMMGVGYNGYVICPEGIGWLCSFGSALFPTSLSLIFTALAIQRIGSTQTAILGAFEPVTAVAIGTLIFGEQLSGNSVVGIMMILIAVTVVVMQKK
jgi:drug/metabolite transporter (DMT)-like permease